MADHRDTSFVELIETREDVPDAVSHDLQSEMFRRDTAYLLSQREGHPSAAPPARRHERPRTGPHRSKGARVDFVEGFPDVRMVESARRQVPRCLARTAKPTRDDPLDAALEEGARSRVRLRTTHAREPAVRLGVRFPR